MSPKEQKSSGTDTGTCMFLIHSSPKWWPTDKWTEERQWTQLGLEEGGNPDAGGNRDGPWRHHAWEQTRDRQGLGSLYLMGTELQSGEIGSAGGGQW